MPLFVSAQTNVFFFKLKSEGELVMFETSVDITALNASLGAYCQHDAIYHLKEVFSALQSFDKVMVYDKVKDRLPLISPRIGNVVQKGETRRFNPPSTFGFGVGELVVQPWKVDFSFSPLDWHKSYLARREAPGSYPFKSAFEFYIFDMVLKAAKSNIESAIWRGIYSATPAADGVANPLVVCDGFLKIFTDNTANCNVASTGAITASNAVDAFEATWEATPYAVRGEGMKLYCSEPAWDKYKKNYRERFGALPYNNQYDKVYLDSSGTKLEIVPIREMGNSNRLIIDPMNVMAIGTDLGVDMQRIMSEPDLPMRSVNIIMDGKIGTGISAWTAGNNVKLLTINDQA